MLDFMERIMVSPKMKRTLNQILEKMNQVIQRLIHNYYAYMLKLPLESKITVEDAITYELTKTDKKIKIVNGPYELLFFIDEPQKKKTF